MVGFAIVDVASYSKNALTPEAFHGMVHVKWQMKAKMVICVESLHRSVYTMVRDESVTNPESVEYTVNNFVNGHHYWSI